MQVDRDQLMRDGFLVLREMVAPDELDAMRASYDTIIERQGGDDWLGSGGAQPRCQISPFLDESVANAAEIWLGENTLGVANQLISCPGRAGCSEMWVMCNPLVDHGPANWHRDIHPIDMAPMHLLQEDLRENGPRYVQWNIPLYDDDVLWVVRGSHLRLNSDEENAQLEKDDQAPLPGSEAVALKAGDGVVYINVLLHWGSDYSSKPRRTLHGGHALHTLDPSRGSDRFLSGEAQGKFESFRQQSAAGMDATEAALRAAAAGDAGAYGAALDQLEPGIGDAGKLVLSVYLAKLSMFIRVHHRGAWAGYPAVLFGA